jgi:hypothetical protein
MTKLILAIALAFGLVVGVAAVAAVQLQTAIACQGNGC